MERSTEKMELLGAQDVARLLGVKETTVWRWCREGNLPCLKVGKHWRVRREALEDFLRRSERSTTLVGQLSSFLRVPDSVLAIAQDLDTLHRLDAAFFLVGEARGGLLVKFYGGEDTPADELRADFEENGEEGRTVWASFDWVRQIDPDTALEQQRLTELVNSEQLVVKTAALEEAIDEWSA